MTTFILGAIVGLCAWLLYFLLRWLQPRFWPPARRQERLRIRLRKTRDDLRRDRVAEETSVASRLSVGERRALNYYKRAHPDWTEAERGRALSLLREAGRPLTLAEVERAFHIPQMPSSLKAPSSAATTPPADPQSTGRISSASSGVKVDGR